MLYLSVTGGTGELVGAIAEVRHNDRTIGKYEIKEQLSDDGETKTYSMEAAHG